VGSAAVPVERNCKFKEKVPVFRYWKEKQAAFRTHPVENELLFCRRDFSWRRWIGIPVGVMTKKLLAQPRGEAVLKPCPVTGLFVTHH